jgi:uncharacterized protein
MLASDVKPMPKGRFVEVVIPLYYEGPAGTANVSVAFSKNMPTSLILPVVPGVNVPTALPACPSLRNEPCRPTWRSRTGSVRASRA